MNTQMKNVSISCVIVRMHKLKPYDPINVPLDNLVVGKNGHQAFGGKIYLKNKGVILD